MKREVPKINQRKKDECQVMNTLVIANHPYVLCIAKRFQNNGLTFHDLIIHGNIGHHKAREHFDQTTGFTFSQYAIWSIRQAIIKAFVEDLKNKPIPLDKIGLISKDNSLFITLERYCQREPTITEINEMLVFQTQIMVEAYVYPT